MADEGEPLSSRQIGAVVNGLTQEHATRVAARDARRAWGRVESHLATAPTARDRTGAATGTGRLLGIAAAVAVAAGLFLAMSTRADSELRYELRGGTAQGGVIEATRGEATIALSDGSSILAENQTRFSLDVVGRNAAIARLVSGKLHVRVEHNEDTSYRFIAGPYEVRVVGTEFDLSWAPDGDGLTLVMASGEVRLAEPGGKLRTLKSGQSLRLPGLSRKVVREAAAPPPPVESPRATTEPEVRARPPEVEPREVAATASWDALVAKGQFAEVVREAETLGIESALGARSASDLKALGQAARYVGQRALAVRAFTALRRRNRGSDSAGQAAFFLARLQEEQGNQAEALRWLGTYLNEAPAGVYAAEAQGRRLSLTERLQGTAAARPLAREYLERFPQGAYSQLARGIADRP